MVCLFCCDSALAANTNPVLNKGGKWRIAYYQGGPIPFYSNIQKEIIRELMRNGWIDESPLPAEGLDSDPPYWDWLCTVATSQHLEFLPENGFSASWDNKKRQAIRKDLLSRLQKKEVDLIIAMGTWAGEDLVNDRHSVSTLVMSASDFEKTWQIRSALADAGYESHGRHNARSVKNVLTGTQPQEITQVAELPFSLSINSATAGAIGYAVPESIIRIARGVYYEQ